MNYRIILRKLLLAATTLIILISFQNCAQDVNFTTANKTSTFNNDYYEAVFKTSKIDQKQNSVVVGSNGIESSLTLGAETKTRSENFEQISRSNYTDLFQQGYKPSNHSESFTQNSNSGLLDILIVIDDSGSMNDEQVHLAQRMKPLLSAIDHTDWKIGVVTTKPNQVCMRAVIDNQDINYEEDFKTAIEAGANGGTELGVDNALIGLRCDTPSWIRANSSIAILFVTDEDDDSSGTQKTLFDELTSMGREVGVDARIYGLLNLAQKGHYDDIITASSGIYGSVNSADYSSILTQISQDLATILKNQFELAVKPNSQPLSILVNGKAWTGNYTVNDKTLTFTDTLPPEGSKIDVNYSAGGAPITKSFALSKKALEGSANVTVNGIAVNMSQFTYDKINNKIVFNSIPAEKSDIVVKYKEDVQLIKSFKLAALEIIPESISIKAGANQLTDFTFINQNSEIVFNTPITEAMSFNVTYTEFLKEQLVYSPSLLGDGIKILSVVDAETKAPVGYDYINGLIKIHSSEYDYNRKLKVRYSNNDLNSTQITLDKYAVLSSVKIYGDNNGSCSLSTQSAKLFCDTDRPLNITIAYTTSMPVTEFTLTLNPFLDTEQGKWEVLDLNENPIANYNRRGNVVSFNQVLNASEVIIRFTPIEDATLASN